MVVKKGEHRRFSDERMVAAVFDDVDLTGATFHNVTLADCTVDDADAQCARRLRGNGGAMAVWTEVRCLSYALSAMGVCYAHCMTLRLRARVRGGRLILDEPIDLPEGAEIELVPANDEDDLDEGDRARLDEALTRAADQLRAGEGIDAAEALARIRARE